MATMERTRFQGQINEAECWSQAATMAKSQERRRAVYASQLEAQSCRGKIEPARNMRTSSKAAKLDNTFSLSISHTQAAIRSNPVVVISLVALTLAAFPQATSSAQGSPEQANRGGLSPVNRRSLFDVDDTGAGGSINGVYDSAAPLALSEQLALSSGSGAGGEKPRLIPLVAADSGYSENSSVNVLCTVSQGHHETLQFEWFKDGQLLPATATTTQAFSSASRGHSDTDLQDAFGSIQPASVVAAPQFVAPQIEKHADHSLLRISRVQSHHSGRYTCAAKNKFGQDSSSVNLIVNVKLQWIKEPPKEIVVSLNQELKMDCLAGGEPKPSMRWEKLDSFQAQGSAVAPANAIVAGTGVMQQQQQQRATSGSKQRQQGSGSSMLMHQQHGNGGQLASAGAASEYIDSLTTSSAASSALSGSNGVRNQLASRSSLASSNGASDALLVSSSRYLNIQRVRESDSGIYECIASNSHGTDLRKLVNVQVKGLVSGRAG